MKKSKTWQLMGTVVEATIWHEDADYLLEEVEQLLYLYQHRFSANDLTSELMEVNLNAGVQSVPVAADLYEVIALGKKHSCARDSFLNIAIGPLVQAWRIGFTDAQVPSGEEIAKALEITDPSAIILDEETRSVYLAKAGMRLDLGALAKGYIADRIIAFLETVGVQQGFINLGGNLRLLGSAGHHRDGKWRIGLQDPRKPRGEHLAILSVPASSLVTSGTYERVFTCEDRTYHHIFDRQTGYPLATDVASVTIVSEQSIDGEIWTTRLFGFPAEELYQKVVAEPDLEAVIVQESGQLLVTPGLVDCLLAVEGEEMDTTAAASSSDLSHFLDTDAQTGASVL